MIHLCSLFNRNLSVVYVGMSQIHIYVTSFYKDFFKNHSEVYLKVSPASEKLKKTTTTKHNMTLTGTGTT